MLKGICNGYNNKYLLQRDWVRSKTIAKEMTESGTVDAIRKAEGNLRYEYFSLLDDEETVLLNDMYPMMAFRIRTGNLLRNRWILWQKL